MSPVRAGRAPVSPDRRGIAPIRLWVLTLLIGAQIWATLSSLTLAGTGERSLFAEAAAVCAVLIVFGLRSVPLRWVVRAATLASALAMARFGALGVLGGIGGSWRVLVWLAVTAAALTLAPSSRAVPGRAPGVVVRAEDVAHSMSSTSGTAWSEASPGRTPSAGSAGTHSSAGPSGSTSSAGPSGVPRSGAGRLAGIPAVLLLAAVAIVGASALLVGPRVSQLFPVGTSAGDLLDTETLRAGSALSASSSIDMTRRPRLSDTIVMAVRSPVASFWRTATFDHWDGSTWRRDDELPARLVIDGVVEHPPDDLAAAEPDTSGGATTPGGAGPAGPGPGGERTVTEQEFRIEVVGATALPTAPTPLEVDAPVDVGQWPDATLMTGERSLGRGATYSVRSAQVPTSPEDLRAAGAGAVPASLLRRFAEPPVATERVRRLAAELTEGLDNSYDKVRALEGWMDDNTEYSLDAPLSPSGVDVVDHFLFESRLGWCEQIASSLVVMARSVGVPARLTTGFVPGDWDPVGRRFLVRELHAHAWAEVWFPDVGWITFDPTATVPLAGTDEATPGAAAIDWREVGGEALLAVAVAALLAGPVRARLRRRRERRARRRADAEMLEQRWDVAEERRIEAVGADAGHVRPRSQTLTSYAHVVAAVVGDDGIAERGRQVDRHRYGPGGSAEPERTDEPSTL